VEGKVRKGTVRWSPSPGGLVQALSQVLRRQDGIWFGWAGLPGEHDVEAGLEEDGIDLGFPVRPVPLTKKEVHDYYLGFSNEIVWPLFHDLHPYCNFKSGYWEAYEAVNDRFAHAVASHSGADDIVWVHDYHLMGVGERLRARGAGGLLTFFLHIPFPASDTFRRFPWHIDLIRSMLAYDRIGFQTRHDASNFIRCVLDVMADVQVVQDGGGWQVTRQGRTTEVGAFPIGIDADEITAQANTPEIDARVAHWRSRSDPDHVFLLGVERLDYTKGIPERLEAFRLALRHYPELRGKVTLLQHVDPSRQGIASYVELRDRVERLVGQINGEFGTMDWTPVRYSARHVDFNEVLALYRFSDVALVTPVRDGMNLVAKEFCAAHADDDGILILSQFTGAAEQLGANAILVNPHDADAMAKAIHDACAMPPEERRRRMKALREAVRQHCVRWWVHEFLPEQAPQVARTAVRA